MTNHTNMIQKIAIEDIAWQILAIFFRYQRRPAGQTTCRQPICHTCIAPHLDNIINKLKTGQRLQFILPAFPAKSPNLRKVTGPLPDMAELLALQFLHRLCEEIATLYAPGAEIILCSDGRVFNDILDITDENVTAYQIAIQAMIDRYHLHSLSIFNLDYVNPQSDFRALRLYLHENFAEDLLDIKKCVKAGNASHASHQEQAMHHLYCGMTRFLAEDMQHPQQILSNTAIQKMARERAYLVIQRSRAWGHLLDDVYPNAVRLSIHPQPCGSSKLGIRLIEEETWLTPWHGVALRANKQFYLVKRHVAEAMGAELIDEFQQPSFYQLNQSQST